MKTEELVRLLAGCGAAVDRRAQGRRFFAPLAAATLICLAAVLGTVGLRPDWREAVMLPMFWVKLAFPAAIALSATVLLRDLGHPGARWRAAALALTIPFVMVWFVAAFVLAAAPAGQRIALVLGSSWLICIASVSGLSIPAFVLAFAAVRSLAPTRLALTGAVAGLVAGSVAAFAYALHCDEMQVPFLAVWYVLGMLLPAAAGALVGKRLLRW